MRYCKKCLKNFIPSKYKKTQMFCSGACQRSYYMSVYNKCGAKRRSILPLKQCPTCGKKTNRWVRHPMWRHVCERCALQLKEKGKIYSPIYSRANNRLYGKKWWVGRKVGRFVVVDIPFEPICNGSNTETVVTIRCTNGHILKRRVKYIGVTCQQCQNKNSLNKLNYQQVSVPSGKHTFLTWKNFLLDNTDVTLLSSPKKRWSKGSKMKVQCRCWCGNVWTPNWTDLTSKKVTSCGCVSNTSYSEKEVFKLVQSLVPSAMSGFHLGKNFKADIFCPEQKLVIEYNGLRWHRGNKDAKKYRYIKSKGLDYLGIFEDEWQKNKLKVADHLKHRLKVNKHPNIRPQRLNIANITFAQTKVFLTEHHIQGQTAATHHVGAFLGKRLVAVMCISRPSRPTPNATYEIRRMCRLPEFHSVGLWSYMWKWVRNNLPLTGKVITFSDNRKDSGNTYKQMGFTLEKEIPPDYYWVRGVQRKHKSAMRTPKGISEIKYWTEKKWHRLYDCGKKRWSYTISS